MSEPQPPCLGCGVNPPPGVKWDLVEYAVAEGEKYIPWTRCPACSAVAESGVPSPRDRGEGVEGVDDITASITAVKMILGGSMPRIAERVIELLRYIPRVVSSPSLGCFNERALTMPDAWSVPVGDLLKLVGAVLQNDRVVALGALAEALADAGPAQAGFAALTPEQVSASFGTTRVPASAARAIVEHGTVAFAAAPIAHAAHCHATVPTPDRPDGGCICGAWLLNNEGRAHVYGTAESVTVVDDEQDDDEQDPRDIDPSQR